MWSYREEKLSTSPHRSLSQVPQQSLATSNVLSIVVCVDMRELRVLGTHSASASVLTTSVEDTLR